MARPLRVLIFEDNDPLRELLVETVRSAGYEVHDFENPRACPFDAGSTCACQPAEACADAIVCDLDMPFQRGIEFLETYRRKGCRIEHLLMMSGGWADEDIRRARALGCQIIQKPFGLDQVLSWLRKVAAAPDPSIALADWFRLTGTPANTDPVAT